MINDLCLRHQAHQIIFGTDLKENIFLGCRRLKEKCNDLDYNLIKRG